MQATKTLLAFCTAWCGWLTVATFVQAAPQPHARVLEAQDRRVAMAAKASRSAIAIFDSGGGGGGSGVVITADGYALTNFHVVQPCGPHMKCGMDNGRLYDAVVVGVDPVGDVALIKLLGRNDFPAAEMGDSDQVQVGQWCFTVGNPFLLATDFQPSVAWGMVSGVRRYQYPAGTLLEYTDCIQTDAAINPGNSGGPLFDTQAKVIGINGRASFEKRGRVNVGVGYAISINQIKRFLGYLHSGRILDHATLGATVSTDDDGRVMVTNILSKSAAYRRGLRFGDEIVFLGDRVIDSVNGLKNALGVFPRGWRIPISFRRDGERNNVEVRLASVHRRQELLEMVQGQVRRPLLQPGDDPEEKKENPLRPQKKLPGEPFEFPPHIAKVYQQRNGYANYYFNALHQKRVWQQFQMHGDFTKYVGDWVLAGQMKGGESLELVLDNSKVFLQAGSKSLEVQLSQFIDEADGFATEEERDVAYRAMALGLYRQFLTLSPARFGEVYYLGTVPGYRDREMCEVLVGTSFSAECHFQFDIDSGILMAMELFLASDEDPLVLLFREYDNTEYGNLPRTVRFLRGEDFQGSYLIHKWEMGKPRTAGFISG